MALAGSTTTLGGVQEDWAHGETFAGWDNGHDVKRATDTERWASPYRWQAVRWRRRYFELFGSGVPSDPHLHSTYLTRAKRQPDKNIPKFLSDLHLDCDGVTRDVGKECPCGIPDVPSRAMPTRLFSPSFSGRMPREQTDGVAKVSGARRVGRAAIVYTQVATTRDAERPQGIPTRSVGTRSTQSVGTRSTRSVGTRRDGFFSRSHAPRGNALRTLCVPYRFDLCINARSGGCPSYASHNSFYNQML